MMGHYYGCPQWSRDGEGLIGEGRCTCKDPRQASRRVSDPPPVVQLHSITRHDVSRSTLGYTIHVRCHDARGLAAVREALRPIITEGFERLDRDG